jgi:hypothetical protein
MKRSFERLSPRPMLGVAAVAVSALAFYLSTGLGTVWPLAWRFGDWFGWAAVLALGALVVVATVSRRRDGG